MENTKPRTVGLVTSMWDFGRPLTTYFINTFKGSTFAKMSPAQVNTGFIDVFKESAFSQMVRAQRNAYFHPLTVQVLSSLTMAGSEYVVDDLCDSIEQKASRTIPPLARGVIKTAVVVGIASALGTSVVPYATIRAFSILFPEATDRVSEMIFSSSPPPALPVPAPAPILYPFAGSDHDVDDEYEEWP